MLLKHSEDQSSTLGQKEPSTSSLLPTCSYSAEIQELGTTLKNNNNFSKTCKTCGEIVLESEYLVHKKNHLAMKNSNKFLISSTDTLTARESIAKEIANSSILPPQESSNSPIIIPSVNIFNSPPPPSNHQNNKQIINPLLNPLNLLENSNSFKPVEIPNLKEPDPPPLVIEKSSKNSNISNPNAILNCNLEKQNKKRYQLIRANSPKYIQQNRRVSLTKIISLMCPQCGLGFENRCKLTRHLMDHKMASNPYRCHFTNCLQSYDSRIKFRSHLIRVHKQLSEDELNLLLEEGDKEVINLKNTPSNCSSSDRKRSLSNTEFELSNKDFGENSSSSINLLPNNNGTGSSDVEFSIIKEEIQEAVNKDLENFAVYEGHAAGCTEGPARQEQTAANRGEYMGDEQQAVSSSAYNFNPRLST